MEKTFKRAVLLAVCCLFALSFVGVSHAAARPAYTIAVYLDSDNNLDDWAQKDLNKMLAVGSTPDVNILVFWDRADGPAYAYKVNKGSLQPLNDFTINGTTANGKEPNMGDPVTLNAWVDYTKKNFPADKYILVLWDHGDDYRGAMYDSHIPQDGFDMLSHQEIVEALKGTHIDALVYGACVIQMIEVSYEYAASGLQIDYLLANEAYDPMDGYPWDTILGELAAKPTMSPKEFCNMCVNDYIYYYNNLGKAYSQAVTLSVLDMSKVMEVVQNMTGMIDAMMSDMGNYFNIIGPARSHSNLPWSENGWEKDIDMKTLFYEIYTNSCDPKKVQKINKDAVARVKQYGLALKTLLDDPNVLYYKCLKGDKAGYKGIGIFFPTSRSSYENNSHLYGECYPIMKFTRDAHWLDFLDAYWR